MHVMARTIYVGGEKTSLWAVTTNPVVRSASGHEPRFERFPIDSGLPQEADIVGSSQGVSTCQTRIWTVTRSPRRRARAGAGGMVRPIAFAVFALMTSSYLVGA